MLRLARSFFNKHFRSQTSASYRLHPLLNRRPVARTVVALVVLSLLPTSTPAATVTLVQFATESKASFGFWFRSADLLGRLYSAFTPAQENEKQLARDSRVHRLAILPEDVTVQEGQKVNFVAVAYDKDGNAVGGVNFKWSALNEERGRAVPVSPRGDFQATEAGNFQLSVEGAGRKTSTKIHVVEGKRKRKDDDKPIEIKTKSSRDLPPEALAKLKINGKTTAPDRSQPDSRKSTKEKFAHSRNLKEANASAAHAPYFLDDGWGNDNYWSADDPGNRRGDPPGAPVDGGAGSGNFQIAAPVLSLPGRGIDVQLALSYNSRVWNKAGTNMNFDIDRDWPAPGWSFGFGKLLGMGVYNGGMLIDADGTRHAYSGTVTIYNWGTTFVGHTTDGTFIDYSYTSGTNGYLLYGQATLANGTRIDYNVQGPQGVFPTRITDANGNFITITYVNNQGPSIQTITDTLGRTITFHYDSGNRLTAITAPNQTSGTRTLVRLHYSQLTLGYHFSGLTAIARDYYPWVIDAIYYPGTGTGYWLDQSAGSYSSYGMLRKVSERRGMTFSGPSPVPPGQGTTEQGTITAGQVTREQFYNYPLNTSDATGTPGSNLTDAPTFSSSTESWTRDGTSTMDQAVTTYNVTTAGSVRTTTITQPNGIKIVQYSHNLPGNYLDGIVYEDRTLDAGNNVLQKSTVSWQQGAYESARPTRIEAIVGSNPKTATEFTYGTVYNQVTDLRSYDYGGTALLKSTRTQYQNSANYTNRHIFNLPLVVEVFASDNTTRVSRTEFQYDGQTLADTPGVIMHDDAWNPHFEPILIPGNCYYDCTNTPIGEPCDYICDPDWWYSAYDSATDYRGNLTQETTYANAVSLSGAVIETNRYDMTGNVITQTNSCCQQTSTTFTVDSYYGFPISETRGHPTDGFHQVKTSATYDFNTGLVLSTTDVDGRTSQATYDPATLRVASRTLPTGAHTDYAYDDTGLSVTETKYLQSHPTHTTIASQTIQLVNGRGAVRQEKALGTGGVWDLVDTVYDSMGRVSQESNPYRSGDTIQWTTTTYDGLNRVSSVQSPDGSTVQNFYNEATRPSVASSSNGETTRVQDAWGRERWSREDASGRIVEIVEPDPSGSGSVATNGLVTTYGYNTNDDLVLVTQGVQARSFKYDSLSRLIAQKSSEASAKLNDAGIYVGSGTWSDVFTYDDRSNMVSHTDARGVKTIFNYNSDPLNRLQSVSWDTTGFGDTENPILAAPTVTYQYRTKGSASQLLDVEQVSGITTAGVSTETYAFDSEGRMSSKTITVTSRPSYPMVVDYNYDALDRLMETRYPAEYGNGTAARKIAARGYDVASRLTGITFDSQTHASNVVYNAWSQPTSLKVGASGANQITENYTFNTQTGLLDNQTIVRGASTTLLNLNYNYAGGNGKRTGQLVSISNNVDHNKDRAYEYDGLGRLKRATGGQNINWTQRYVYDRYGNRTHALSYTAEQYVRNFYQSALNRQPTTTELNGHLSTLQTAYTQGASQLLTAMRAIGVGVFTSSEYNEPDNREFVKDLYRAFLFREPDQSGEDHWTSMVPINGRNNVRLAFEVCEEFANKVNGISPYGHPSGSPVPRDGREWINFDSATNRISDPGWSYDTSGNQTRVQVGAVWQRFQYDAANRLVRVKADNNVTVLASYTYTSDNQRLIAEEGGQRKYFTFDRGGVIAEFSESTASSTPAWSKSYVYMGNRLLSSLVPNGSGGALVDYHHPDRLSTRVVTNAQNTNNFEQVALPFGTSFDIESTGATNRRFTSYDRSLNTGLDYALNRFYDSQQGRFTQVDPIGAGAADVSNPQSWNMYEYVGNDPVNRTDPTGLFFKSFFKWLGKALKWIALAAMIATAIISVVGMIIGTVALKAFLTTTLLGKILAFTASIPDIIGGFISGLPKAIAGIFSFAERGTAIVTRVIGNLVLMGGSAAAGAVADSLEEDAKKETGKARRRREKAERRARRERPPTRPTLRVPGIPEIKQEPRIGRPEVRVPPKPSIPVQNPSNPELPKHATTGQKIKFGIGQGLRILGRIFQSTPIQIMINPEAVQDMACQENPYSQMCIYGPFPGCCRYRGGLKA